MPLRCQVGPVWHVSNKPALCQETCQLYLSNPFRCGLPMSMINRQNTHNHHHRAATHCEKNQVENEITNIYMMQVRRKETNLLVRNVLYASNTQDRPLFCKVVGV